MTRTLLLLIDRDATPEAALRIKEELARQVGMPVIVVAGGRQVFIVDTEDDEP